MLLLSSFKMKITLVVVAVMLATSVSSVVGLPIAPNLPQTFSDTNLTFSGPYSGNPTTTTYPNAEMYYDLNAQGQRIDFQIPIGNYTLPFVIIQTNATYIYDNGVCRFDSPATFQNLWSWVSFAKYGGTYMIEGKNTSEFYFTFNSELLAVYVLTSSFEQDTQIPVQAVFPSGNPTYPNVTFFFSDSFSTNPFDSSVFEIGRECFEKPVCPAGPTVNESIYLFHGANDFTLINTNVADQLGDVAFVCLADTSNMFSYFSWISYYVVSFNTTWGQYGLCNFGSCLGGAEDRVGKEATEGIDSATGQCGTNAQIGNWYSLPPYNETLCPEYANGTIGINNSVWFGCGWNIVTKVKTINGSCLSSNGFVEACIADGEFPFPKAQQIWEQAFASDDPSEGGCPPIGPTDFDETVSKAQRPTTISAQQEIQASLFASHSFLAEVYSHLEL